VEEPAVPESLQTIAFLSALGGVVLILMALVALVIRQLRGRILGAIRAFFKKLLFNGLIRMNSLQFIKWSIFLALNVDFARGRGHLGGFLLAKVVLVSIYVLSAPLVTMIFLLRNYDHLDTPEYRAKYRNMYGQIGWRRGRAAVLYYPLFLFRRFCMVAITGIFSGNEGVQLQFLALSTTAYVLAYGALRPHWSRAQRRYEMLNETLFMVMTYSAMCFTGFVRAKEAQFQMGYVEVGAVILLILANLSHLAYVMATKFGDKKEN